MVPMPPRTRYGRTTMCAGGPRSALSWPPIPLGFPSSSRRPALSCPLPCPPSPRRPCVPCVRPLVGRRPAARPAASLPPRRPGRSLLRCPCSRPWPRSLSPVFGLPPCCCPSLPSNACGRSRTRTAIPSRAREAARGCKSRPSDSTQIQPQRCNDRPITAMSGEAESQQKFRLCWSFVVLTAHPGCPLSCELSISSACSPGLRTQHSPNIGLPNASASVPRRLTQEL
jgi:hypothetical protein